MNTPEFRAGSDASLVPMHEEELATYRRGLGANVVAHRGRYWYERNRGLFEPVHLMARLNAAEATRPAPWCWGFRAALSDASAAQSNGSMPVHLLADVAAYGVQSLSANRRYHLRRSQRAVQIVQVLGPQILASDGYEVFLSAGKRTGMPHLSKEQFLSSMDRWISSPSSILLAGLVGDRLGGYVAGFAVEHTAYIEVVDLATEALSTHISTGLHFEFIQACRRSVGVNEIVHSPHIPEDPRLGVFKAGIGFPVVNVPSRIRMFPPIDALLRWRKPFAHYRLTGQENGAVRAATTAGVGQEAALRLRELGS
jgi:hypothetical protein